VSTPLVAAVWALVSLDCGLMGYRLAMGRSGLVDKRRAHLRASLRAIALGQLPLAGIVVLAELFVRHEDLAAADVDTAMRRLVVAGGAFAVLILGTWALVAVPSVPVRAAANVIVFGPFTLLRPPIVVATVAFAVWGHASTPLLVIAALVVIPGVLVEPLADLRLARRALDPPNGR